MTVTSKKLKALTIVAGGRKEGDAIVPLFSVVKGEAIDAGRRKMFGNTCT